MWQVPFIHNEQELDKTSKQCLQATIILYPMIFFGDNEFLCNKRTMMLLNKMRKNSLGTKEDILEVEMKVIN